MTAMTSPEITYTSTYAVELCDPALVPPLTSRLIPASDRIHAYEIALAELEQLDPDLAVDITIGPMVVADNEDGPYIANPDHTATSSAENLQIAVQTWRDAHVLANPFDRTRFPRDAELIARVHFPRTWIRAIFWSRRLDSYAARAHAQRLDDGKGWPPCSDGDGIRFVTLPVTGRLGQWRRPRLAVCPIGLRCPQCRRLRGYPQPRQDGRGQEWTNECGHVDDLTALRRESLWLELARDVWARTPHHFHTEGEF